MTLLGLICNNKKDLFLKQKEIYNELVEEGFDKILELNYQIKFNISLQNHTKWYKSINDSINAITVLKKITDGKTALGEA